LQYRLLLLKIAKLFSSIQQYFSGNGVSCLLLVRYNIIYISVDVIKVKVKAVYSRKLGNLDLQELSTPLLNRKQKKSIVGNLLQVSSIKIKI